MFPLKIGEILSLFIHYIMFKLLFFLIFKSLIEIYSNLWFL
nr:MAG TPA: hypothetical protein [Caudoviricetes sp.]